MRFTFKTLLRASFVPTIKHLSSAVLSSSSADEAQNLGSLNIGLVPLKYIDGLKRLCDLMGKHSLQYQFLMLFVQCLAYKS